MLKLMIYQTKRAIRKSMRLTSSYCLKSAWRRRRSWKQWRKVKEKILLGLSQLI